MTGFTAKFKSKLIETQSHFQIHKPGSAMRSGECRAVLETMRLHNAAGTPVIQGPVLVQYGINNRSLDTQVMLFAAPVKDLRTRLNLDKHLKYGELKLGIDQNNWRDKSHYAVISTDMARRWHLSVGDKFLVHSSTHLTGLVKFNAAGGIEINKNSSAHLPSEFTVSGIYSSASPTLPS